jgi:hypothetical protein
MPPSEAGYRALSTLKLALGGNGRGRGVASRSCAKLVGFQPMIRGSVDIREKAPGVTPVGFEFRAEVFAEQSFFLGDA